MATVMKSLSISLVVVSAVLCFQNCASEFQSIDEFKYGSEYAKDIVEQTQLQSYWDRLYDPAALRAQAEVLFDSKIDPIGKKVFADELTAFFVVTNRNAQSSLTLEVDHDQILKILVQGTRVILTHEAPAGNFSQTTFSINAHAPVVVSARSGKDPKNIMLMVNGEYRTISIQNQGAPLNFNFLESKIDYKNIQEMTIYNRTMEPGEINVLSRELASIYAIPTRTTADMPDYLVWSTESVYFPQVRNIMRSSCFKCHNSWISLSESGFKTASRHTKNIQLVKPKNLEDSPLWHSLKGSSDNNPTALRNMPKDLPALNNNQIELIKNWILSL
jgi:hypothetical protein